MPLIFKKPDEETLYEQLVSRLYHIERAFMVRRHIKLHYSKQVSKRVAQAYIGVRRKYDEFFSTYEESLLWFITVELWSRFTANSKKGLRKLVLSTHNKAVEDAYLNLIDKHKDVIGHINTQRLQYFAHADNVKWERFPNVHDQEYEELIKDLKVLMTRVGETTGSQRRPTTTDLPEQHTKALFDDLLKISSPGKNVDELSDQYDQDVKRFLSER